MLRSRHSWVLRYSVALFASLVALVSTQFLWPYIQPALYPFFLAAVMLSSWFGGLGPGLVATLLAVGFSEYFFLPPVELIAIDWANLGRIIYFAAVATLICILNYREQLARREAEAANQSKDEFLAILSHELRTPLTAITGWVGMLRSGKLDALRTRMALETIERNAILQMQLVEDLLDISRIIRGDLWLDNQPINLVDVIRDTIAMMQPKIEEKQIQLRFHLDTLHKTASVFVLGDAERFEQIMLNLLSNAIKFTPDRGTITVSLRVNRSRVNQSQVSKNYLPQDYPGWDGRRNHHGCSRNRENSKPCQLNDEVWIQVRDTGVGISPEFLPHVFDRFRQADSTNARSYKGLGLGLAIARYLVERQGGRIQAESLGQGQGATFTVKLSLYRLGEHAAPIKTCSEQSLEARLQGLSVLVVDDEVDTRNWLKTVFEMHQARVATAPSVDEALFQLDRAAPDIVISDIAMPGKDGYGLVDQLRQREKQLGRSIPAIALTSHASLTEIEKSRVAGFQHYLTKPVTAEALIAVILQQLEPVQPSRGSAP